MLEFGPDLSTPPVACSDPEWALLTQGLGQRMRLLDAIAGWVYGRPASAREGILPSALTLGHGAYLPMLEGVQPLGGRHLSLMTFDVACDHQGHWWVLGQNSRAALPQPGEPPAGLQYWLRHWQHLGPGTPNEAPHWVVLLPPGASDLASWASPWSPWGISAARATDLLVRHHDLFLQTPQGLRVVHGLINLQGHDTLDPLEQACPVDQGIAGLFDVLRHARVQVLNAPGLVFLDSPAWLGFLPVLCQQILGEDLLLPSITSWWCGEPEVWSQALRKGLDHGFIPTYPDDGLRPTFAPQSIDGLSDVQLSAWAHRIRRHPEHYTVQKRWSGTPSLRVLTLLGPQMTHSSPLEHPAWSMSLGPGLAPVWSAQPSTRFKGI